jgi:hypothetical protein
MTENKVWIVLRIDGHDNESTLDNSTIICFADDRDSAISSANVVSKKHTKIIDINDRANGDYVIKVEDKNDISGSVVKKELSVSHVTIADAMNMLLYMKSWRNKTMLWGL